MEERDPRCKGGVSSKAAEGDGVLSGLRRCCWRDRLIALKWLPLPLGTEIHSMDGMQAEMMSSIHL